MTKVVANKFILFSILLLIIPPKIKAQRFETGGSLGIMKYEGDIGGSSSTFGNILNNKTSRASVSGCLDLSYSPLSFLTIRIAALVGSVQAADSLMKNPDQKNAIKKIRNLHFRSPVREASLIIAIHPFDFTYSEVIWKRKLSPYLVFGVGVFNFNPMGWYQNPSGPNRWVALQPLKTEGQGMSIYPNSKEYSLRALNLQAGAGIKYQISSTFSLSLEILNRRTNTDYLDDVSGRYIDNDAFDAFFGIGTIKSEIAKQMANNPAFKNGGQYVTGFLPGSLRGSPASKDYYYISSLRIGYRLGQTIGQQIQQSRLGILDCIRF